MKAIITHLVMGKLAMAHYHIMAVPNGDHAGIID